jgi:hypothetical protein
MAKLSKKSHSPEAPAPTAALAPRVALRLEAAGRRLRILERMTGGLSVRRISRAQKSGARRPQQMEGNRQSVARPQLAAAREDLTAKRNRPEMAPQRLEKIEFAPGNGMASEASKPQHLVHGRAADRALRRSRSPTCGPAATVEFDARGGRWEIFRLATPWNR